MFPCTEKLLCPKKKKKKERQKELQKQNKSLGNRIDVLLQ
jgi:hypothetical protein